MTPIPTTEIHVGNPRKASNAMDGAKRATPVKIVICSMKIPEAKHLTATESKRSSKY